MSGRKPLAPAENRLPELVEDAAPRLAELQSQAILMKQEQEQQASALMSAGGIRALSFTQTILDVAQLAEYENIKKSKAWRDMVNPETQTHFGNLDEWCRHYLGKTYERMRQISANRNLIGQEAFDRAHKH